jgi:hypothetical protein
MKIETLRAFRIEKALTVKKKHPERRNNFLCSYLSASRKGERSDLRILIIFSLSLFCADI